MQNITVEERIIAGLFLFSNEPNKVLEELKPEWIQKGGLPITEKISFLSQPDLIKDIFPWVDELSDGINKEEFALSHLRQPDLFLRLRPGKEIYVKQKLRLGSWPTKQDF